MCIRDSRVSDRFLDNSPTNAPKKAPIMIPIGPKKIIPIIVPKVEPITPDLEPPNFLAPIEGII